MIRYKIEILERKEAQDSLSETHVALYSGYYREGESLRGEQI